MAKLLSAKYKTREGADKRCRFENAIAKSEFDRGDKAKHRNDEWKMEIIEKEIRQPSEAEKQHREERESANADDRAIQRSYRRAVRRSRYSAARTGKRSLRRAVAELSASSWLPGPILPIRP